MNPRPDPIRDLGFGPAVKIRQREIAAGAMDVNQRQRGADRHRTADDPGSKLKAVAPKIATGQRCGSESQAPAASGWPSRAASLWRSASSSCSALTRACVSCCRRRSALRRPRCSSSRACSASSSCSSASSMVLRCGATGALRGREARAASAGDWRAAAASEPLPERHGHAVAAQRAAGGVSYGGHSRTAHPPRLAEGCSGTAGRALRGPLQGHAGTGP